MYCPSCDSDDFGIITNVNGDIVRYCSDCEYQEEASPGEVAEYIEEQQPQPAPEEMAPLPAPNWFATEPANPANYLPNPPPTIQGAEAHLIIRDEVHVARESEFIGPPGHAHTIGFITHDTSEGVMPEREAEELTPEQLEQARQVHAALKQKMMQEREQRRQQLPCKFYCPSLEEQDAVPHNWPWDRKLPFGACTNPGIVGQAGVGACQFPTQRGACPGRRDPEPAPVPTPFITQLVN